MKRAVRFLAILVVVLIVVGSIADLCDGFRVLRSTHSWRMALLAMLGLGTLELLGEGVSGWLFRRGPR
ncbi:MAG TPA: hypothetical protein VMR86_07025 [Myxococcota bacterium]|nr:hypothetical protein [Myxococcota bacterium]